MARQYKKTISTQVRIGYDIFRKVPKEEFNHNDHYEYAQTEDGRLYRCLYGCEFEDCYITCFEELDGEDFVATLDNLKYYLKKVGRVPYEYIKDFSWRDVEGLTLSFTTVNSSEVPCFIDYENNKCYIILDGRD